MKTLIIMLLFSSLFTATPAFAGAGHDHSHGHSHGPISKEKAIHKAEKQLGQLVKRGKIDKSWADKKATSVVKKAYSGKQEWVVTFNNPGISDKSKQTLYMFFKLDGHYLATNYTGK